MNYTLCLHVILEWVENVLCQRCFICVVYIDSYCIIEQNDHPFSNEIKLFLLKYDACGNIECLVIA